MNNDKDHRLEALFAEAATEVPDERFTVGVMGRVDRMRYRVMLAWVAAALVMLLCAWLLAGPVMHAVDMMLGLLPRTWLELDNRVAAVFLAPINSIGAIAGLALFVVYRLVRKLF